MGLHPQLSVAAAHAGEAQTCSVAPPRGTITCSSTIGLPVLPAKDERRRLELRHDDDAMGLLEEILRNALVRRCHDLGQHGRGRVQSLCRFIVLREQRCQRYRRRGVCFGFEGGTPGCAPSP